jgi:AcrR family transcriptional regulator
MQDMATSTASASQGAPRRVGRPSLDEAERLDRAIIGAARALFLLHGFAGTTIEAIAATCGTTRRSIITRFANKERLFAIFCEEHCDAFTDEVMRQEQGSDPVAGLRAIAMSLLGHALAPDNIAFQSNCGGELGKRPAIAARVIAINDRLERDLERRILAAQADGFFCRFDARALATVLVSTMLSNPINRAMMGDPQFATRTTARHYFDTNWAIFLAMM